MKKNALLFVSMFIALSAQGQQKFTLSSAQEYALDHAYGVQIAKLEIDRAKQIYRQNLASGLPQASAQGQYAYNIELASLVADLDNDPSTLEKLTFGTDYQAQGGLVVTQLIFDGSFVVGLMAAKVLKDNAALGMEKSKSELRREVAKAYHLALLSEESVKVLKANEGYLADLAQEMQKLNQAGMVSKADADQMMLNYNNIKNALRFSEGQANVTKMLLKLQMGYAVDQDILLADDLEDLVVKAAGSSAMADLAFDAKKTVDYKSVANRVEGAKLEVKNEYMQYLPSVAVSYQNNIQYQSQDANIFSDNAIDIPSSLVGASISIPLWSSGGGAASLQQSKIRRDQALIGLTQLEQGLKMQHASLVNEFHRSVADYLSQKENVELAQRIRDQRRKEYEQGMVSSMDLTQAEAQYQEGLQGLFLSAQTALDKQSELEYLMTKQTLK